MKYCRALCMFAIVFALAGGVLAEDLRHPPVNAPDAFAWSLFEAINQPVENDAENRVLWETWALARLMFRDPHTRPRWEDCIGPPQDVSRFEPLSRQQALRRRQERIAQGRSPHAPLIDPARPELNETRMNRVAFDFVLENDLWYVEGQERFFLDPKLVSKFKGKPIGTSVRQINFPIEAQEIKALWTRIEEGDKPRYHHHTIVRAGQEQIWGLTSLHITTKDIPNWFWATFEHVDNPGREAVIPDRDSAGRPESLNGTKWENYVLRGSQIDFVTPHGDPTLLASSQIEDGFQATSSCMTCHARATIGPPGTGQWGQRLSVFRPDRQGHVGTPAPGWFFGNGATRPRRFVQTDFVWALARARRRSAVPAPSEETRPATARSGRPGRSTLAELLEQGGRPAVRPGGRPGRVTFHFNNPGRPPIGRAGPRVPAGRADGVDVSAGVQGLMRRVREALAVVQDAQSSNKSVGTMFAPMEDDGRAREMRASAAALLTGSSVLSFRVEPGKEEELTRQLAGADAQVLDVDTQRVVARVPNHLLLGARELPVERIDDGAFRSRASGRVPRNQEARDAHFVNWLEVQLSLNGSGLLAGVWDAGGVREEHQEFRTQNGSRVASGDASGNKPPDAHATHVAGTIGASGRNREAKGMAPSVELVSHDWGADIFELAEAAAEPGTRLICSNHSYGFLRGWRAVDVYDATGAFIRTDYTWYGNPTVNAREDYLFGKYTIDTMDFDALVYYGNYHDMRGNPTSTVPRVRLKGGVLPLIAAGNDRDDQAPPPGVLYRVAQTGLDSDEPRFDDGFHGEGYDTLGELATAKNVLTVGAIHDITRRRPEPRDIRPTPFSSFGPTDDGRIKPDVVANGWRLTSVGERSDTDYRNMSGTSMATPVASGIAVLLAQQFEKEYERLPYPDELKGLLIHTAMDDTRVGPDYRVGWGSLRADWAGQFLSGVPVPDEVASPVITAKGHIVRAEVTAGAVWTLKANKSESVPIRVTLVWIDPPGIPLDGGLDDPRTLLVNDLDLSLLPPSGDESAARLPWVLDPRRPDQPATRGRNTRDNVERVDVAPGDGPNGQWTIRVRGPRQGKQHFAILISGLDPL